jgi:hypothetical protein
MVMSVVGTFDYEFVVLAEEPSACRRIPGTCRENLDNGERGRLVGHAPLLETIECQREAWQLYARVTLRAARRTHATVASASFLVDRQLTSALRGGDRLHIIRTHVAGLGLSILRDGQLVAAGDVTSVPLGRDVRARTPMDPVNAAEAIIRTRDPRTGCSICRSNSASSARRAFFTAAVRPWDRMSCS